VTESTPLVALRNRMARAHASVRQIAERLHAEKLRQAGAGRYSQHRWSHGGSDPGALVCEPGGLRQRCTLWGVNHYTGMQRHPEVISAVQAAAAEYGTGSGTSGMSGGMCSLHKELEAELASRVGKEKALLFPTGYTANVGILSTLPQQGDLVLFDRECHASIIDGLRMSKARWLPFRHNDVGDLVSKLERLRERFRDVFVAIESAYSMSGEFAPLADIAALKQRWRFYLFVDEAHTFGIYGEGGGGYCRQLGVSDDVDFLMSTLSKATASVGGFFAGQEVFVPLLEWCANPYIFQACLTPPDAAAALQSLRVLARDRQIVQRLHENNRLMRELLLERGFDLGESRSPIIPIYVSDDDALLALNRELFERGVHSVSIVYPAVRPGHGRIRFIVTARHSESQIRETVEALAELAPGHIPGFGRGAQARSVREAPVCMR